MLESIVPRVLCLLAAVAVVPLASSPAPAQTQVPTVKHEPAPNVRPDSGVEMYKAYCAPCHGAEGKGDGPAAPAMKTAPTDLTKLSASNGGTFPTGQLTDVLRVGTPLPAHGSADMPVWGRTFRAMDDERIMSLRISNLIKHLQSLQAR